MYIATSLVPRIELLRVCGCPVTHVNSAVQLCLHHILRPQVGGEGVVVLLPLHQELLLVVGAPQVLAVLPPRRQTQGDYTTPPQGGCHWLQMHLLFAK